MAWARPRKPRSADHRLFAGSGQTSRPQPAVVSVGLGSLDAYGLTPGGHYVVCQNGEHSDQARKISVSARPLRTDRGPVMGNRNQCDGAQLALARELQVLLQEVDQGRDLLVDRRVGNRTQAPRAS